MVVRTVDQRGRRMVEQIERGPGKTLVDPDVGVRCGDEVWAITPSG
jgi:hypothetical protein